MNPYYEKVRSSDQSFTAYERNDSSFCFQWHYHPEFELTLILSSQGQRLVGSGIADYGPGDLVLLGPNLPHSWRSGPVKSSQSERHRAIVVQFREDCFGTEFFQLQELHAVGSLLQRASNGLSFGHTTRGRRVAASLANFLSYSPAKRLLSLLGCLVELSEEGGFQVLSPTVVQPICRPEHQLRVDAICGYINKHFAEEIDFDDLCDTFHMAQATLCRFFKRATGRTITTYLNELRVAAAAQLLLDTDDSIVNICFKAGFGNYSNFNRQFKHIKGVGPRELRRQFAIGPDVNTRVVGPTRASLTT